MMVRAALLPNPLTCAPEDSAEALLPRMIDDSEGTAAVLDGAGHFLGLLGLTDILSKIVPFYVQMDDHLANVMSKSALEDHFADLRGKTAAELMVKDVEAVDPDSSLMAAAARIVETGHRVLPVLLKDKTFVGLISRRSLLGRVVEATK
jgi:CBS domain-containing protein